MQNQATLWEFLHGPTAGKGIVRAFPRRSVPPLVLRSGQLSPEFRYRPAGVDRGSWFARSDLLRMHPAGTVECCGADHPSSRLLRRRIHEAHADGHPVTVEDGTARYVQGRCARIAGPSRGRAGCIPSKSPDFRIKRECREVRFETDLRAYEKAQGRSPLEISRTAREQRPSP